MNPAGQAERILIRGVNWLGDAVMAMPAIERLRQSRPGAQISLLTAEKLADLFTGHPDIDRVITFSKADSVLGVASKLRHQFDLALVLPNSFRSAFESFLAGIPARVGFSGSGRRLLLTQTVPRRPGEQRMHKRSDAEVRKLVTKDPAKERDTFPISAHHLHNYLHLVQALGANPDPLPPRLHVSDAERNQFRSRFKIRGRLLLGLNPGAEYGPAKRWPAEHFIQAAQLVPAPAEWLVFGGPSDRAAAEKIAASLGAGVHNLAGQTSLRELCAGLSLCAAVLTNDTGPMHLAAAVGSRVVVPFGSTSPELTGPGQPGSRGHSLILGAAPCAPCFRRTCPVDLRCMLSITPDHAAAALSAIVTRAKIS
jgi:heptosyltransferase-2